MIKIKFEKTIQWKWICLFLASIIFLDGVYKLNDYRYKQSQQSADILAQVVSNLAKVSHPTIASQLNQILEVNGFGKYRVEIKQLQSIQSDTTKEK